MADAYPIPADRRFRNLVGKTFGRLTVISYCGKRLSSRHARWLCRCKCGIEVTVDGPKLSNGHTSSCGCLHKELLAARGTKHGHYKRGSTTLATLRCWIMMNRRCYERTHKHFSYYGGRGIVVCQRWKTSFDLFVKDMGLRPSLEHTIDRIDNNGNYEPGNCRWATMKEQAQHRRRRGSC